VLDAAPVVSEILAAAPRVKALVTSRSPLRISGEREYAVPPLSTPPLDLPLTTEALGTYPSVAFFVDRALAVKSDFVLTKENAMAIAEICVRLDGLPLAIELAAARIKLLPPQAMLSRVDNRLRLLAGGRRDLPERQQTMRAAISWGYNLLDDSEKRLFATLSVFRGGFTIEMAEALSESVGSWQLAVGSGTTDDRQPTTDNSVSDVLGGLSSLVDKAFLRRDAASTDEVPRFTMLETIREYGLECLVEEARLDDVHRAHARLMCALTEQSVSAIDHDNHRAALEWALVNDAALAMRLGASLWWFWYVHGHYAEGMRWLASVLALDTDDQVSRCRAITGAGAMAFLQCDYEGAIELLDASIDLARKTGDRPSLAQALQFRGSIARERGEYDHAIDLHQLSHTIWVELEDRSNAARSMNYIAFSSWLNRDFARAVDLCRMTLQVFRDRGDTDGVAWALLSLAATAFHSGDLDRAEQRLEESLSWSRAGGFKEGIGWSLNLLGYVMRARGDITRAATMQRDSLQLHWDLGDRWRSSSVIEAIAGLAVERGELAKAARLFGAAEALRHKHGTPVPPVEMPQWEKDVQRAQVESVAWDDGIMARVEDVVAEVLTGA
jgi:non-specific serine/threonine protein kinase